MTLTLRHTRALRHSRALATVALATLALANFAACVPEDPPPMPTMEGAAEPATDAAPPPAAAEDDGGVEYFYTPIGKRDPFRPYYLDLNRNEPPPGTALETKRPLGPLEKYEIEQLKLVAIISGIANPKAMIEAPNGKGYIVRSGTPIGKNGGRVARIKRDEVIVEEEYLDSNARRVLNRIRLRLHTESNEDE